MVQYLVQKLREGRSQKGLTQQDVARLTGIKNTTLSNYENGITEPDIDTFLKLCELYELDYARVLGEAYGLKVRGLQGEVSVSPSDLSLLKKYRALTAYEQESILISIDRFLQAPKETKRKASLQRPMAQKPSAPSAAKRQPPEPEAFRSQTGETEPEAAGLLKSADPSGRKALNDVPLRIYPYLPNSASAGNELYIGDLSQTMKEAPYLEHADFIIGVTGNSMEPDFHNGDQLYIEKTDRLNEGEIGIFQKDGTLYVKEVGKDRLVSHNTAFPDIYPGSENITVIGRVLGKIAPKPEPPEQQKS